MVTHPCNSKVKVLAMGLAIFVVTPYDDRQEIDRALSEIMQENPRFEPASKSCIEGLKRVKLVGDSTMMEKCMICLEKAMVGQEVICLPCGHIFHGYCIARWLETSHLCPLCRFSMNL